MFLNCLSVGIGGFLGSILRYLLSLVPFLNKWDLPVQTLAANIGGALLIGVIVGMTDRYEGLSPRLILMLKVGVCGGFTTFSTFSNESLALMQSGKNGLAALYIALSLVICIVGVFVGKTLALSVGR